MSTCLQIENLEVKLGSKSILRNISFSIDKGDILCIIGPNGSGKTTLLRTLLGFLYKSQGNVEYPQLLGKKDYFKFFGYKSENLALYDFLTIGEHIDLVSSLYQMPNNDINELILTFGLHLYLNHTVKTLSQGTKQKLALMLSLLHDPHYVFLDEPTSALDPAVRVDIYNLIEKIKNQGKTCIFTTHLLEDISIATKIAIILDGNLYFFGSKQEFDKEFSSQFTLSIDMGENVKDSVVDLFQSERIDFKQDNLQISAEITMDKNSIVFLSKLYAIENCNITLSQTPLVSRLASVFRGESQ